MRFLACEPRRDRLRGTQLGNFQFPAVANNCNPIANCPASTGTQYTTRARDRKFPSSERTFSRSFGFQGLLVSTRAPRGLTFSVIPSCAGVRTSRLDRSTVIFMGVRSSVRFKMSIEHHRPERRNQSNVQRGNGRAGTSDAGNNTLLDRAVKISRRFLCPGSRAPAHSAVRPRDTLSHERTVSGENRCDVWIATHCLSSISDHPLRGIGIARASTLIRVALLGSQLSSEEIPP
jgi:hypothetical protein